MIGTALPSSALIELSQADRSMRKLHPKQMEFWRSKARFAAVPCGRRSGKTAIALRKLRKAALEQTEYDDAWYVCAAPTRDQAKRIFWNPLKKLFPKQFIVGKPNESDLSIKLVNGVEITVMGMEVPQRIEGRPLNGIILDEYANMKPHVFDAHVRPMLTERLGFAWFIGVPEGRNHYYELCLQARTDAHGEWGYFTWTTEEILPIYLGEEEAKLEIESAKRRMDPLTYAQEYNADFVTFSGMAYYQFKTEIHAKDPLDYYPDQRLIFCFDFNVAPGVAVVVQDDPKETRIIGEVYIPKNSTTPMVCDKLIADWGSHRGMVHGYGDATGGNSGSAKVSGSDWDLIDAKMKAHFGERWVNRVGRSNPPERTRVNAVNCRLMSMSGERHLRLDPQRAPKTLRDFEGVRVIEGSAGELDKKTDKTLTHLTDALGYFIHDQYPVVENKVTVHQM